LIKQFDNQSISQSCIQILNTHWHEDCHNSGLVEHIDMIGNYTTD